MQKTLYGLIELQEVDNRLDELREERGDLPLIVDDLQAKLLDKKKEFENCSSELKQSKVKQRELESVIVESKAKLDKYEEQLYQVKTNKEYDAITLETESAKKQVDEGKDELNNISQLMIGLEEKIELLDGEISKLESEHEENSIELDAKLTSTAEEENLLKQERDIIINKTNSDIVKTYEMVRNARSGQGLAKIEGGVCGGCYSYIPPQKAVEVKKMKKIYTCEFCGRILVCENS